jgi:hypothetical protein
MRRGSSGGHGRWARVPVIVAIVVAVAGPAGAGDFTVELTYSPTTVPPGGTVNVSGTCLNGEVPTEGAEIRAFLVAGQPGAPFDHAADYPVGPTGGFDGEFVLPDNAPPGDWVIQLSCRTDDTVLGAGDEGPLTVAGDPIVTPPDSPPAVTPTFTG